MMSKPGITPGFKSLSQKTGFKTFGLMEIRPPKVSCRLSNAEGIESVWLHFVFSNSATGVKHGNENPELLDG